MKNKGLKILLLTLAICCPKFVFAETIVLKSGKKIEGKIIEKTEEYIKTNLYGVDLTYYLDDIATIDGKVFSIPKVEKDFFVKNNDTQTEGAKIPEELIRNYDIDKVKKAISQGANVNARYRFDSTALMLAVMKQNPKSLELAKLLIDSGTDINAKNDSGETALRRAVFGTLETFKLLIERGADLDIADNRGKTVLMECASRGGRDKVQVLIENGANVNLKDYDNKTALIYAADYRKDLIVELLIVNDADINVKDDNGKTALMYAKEDGNQEMITLFTSSGQKYIKSEKNMDKSTKAQLDKVKALFNEGRSDEGYLELKKLLEIAPDVLPVYHSFGGLVLNPMPTGKTIELLNIFEKAIKKYPNDAGCHYFLANLYETVGRILDAKRIYVKVKRIIDKGPTIPMDYQISVFIDSSLEKIEKDINTLEQEVGLIDAMNPEEKLMVAQKCIKKAETAGMKAGVYCYYAINLAPNNSEIAIAYVGLSGVYSMSKRTSDIAVYYCKKAIELDSQLLDAYLGLFLAYGSEGDEQKKPLAKEAYEKAVALCKSQGKFERLKEIETIAQMYGY
ncbi:MAG: ankyrin repeat domain-containing protein [Candidatus Omnitrophica bacterium]|nr:ankyrin repeat domain-containing protein [Candidatus Omnitrophota bacterium]